MYEYYWKSRAVLSQMYVYSMMRSSLLRMRSSLVVRASDCQCTSCNGPGFDPSIRRHSGIWWAADEAVLNRVRQKIKKSPKKIKKKKMFIPLFSSVLSKNPCFFSLFNLFVWFLGEGEVSCSSCGCRYHTSCLPDKDLIAKSCVYCRYELSIRPLSVRQICHLELFPVSNRTCRMGTSQFMGGWFMKTFYNFLLQYPQRKALLSHFTLHSQCCGSGSVICFLVMTKKTWTLYCW